MMLLYPLLTLRDEIVAIDTDARRFTRDAIEHNSCWNKDVLYHDTSPRTIKADGQMWYANLGPRLDPPLSFLRP